MGPWGMSFHTEAANPVSLLGLLARAASLDSSMIIFYHFPLTLWKNMPSMTQDFPIILAFHDIFWYTVMIFYKFIAVPAIL